MGRRWEGVGRRWRGGKVVGSSMWRGTRHGSSEAATATEAPGSSLGETKVENSSSTKSEAPPSAEQIKLEKAAKLKAEHAKLDEETHEL